MITKVAGLHVCGGEKRGEHGMTIAANLHEI